MASELQTDYLSGYTVYFLLRNSVGQIWNGSSFVTYNSADYANYDIVGAEQGTSGYYTGDMPAVPLGYYGVLAKQQVGGSPAESDITVGSGNLYWTGAVASVLPLVNSSGAVYSDVIQFSGIVINNQLAQVGANVVSGQVNVNSGSVILASGSLFRFTFASGVMGGSGGLPQAWGNSGQVVGASGLTHIASGAFSVVPVSTLSGVIANSGIFATVPSATLSGVVFASGGFVNASLNSGQFVNVYSGQLSGQEVNVSSGTLYPASGTTQIASGAFVVVPLITLSGVVFASGGFVTASLNSGQSVNVYSGQLSGQQITAQTVSDKSGYVLGNLGLDFVWPESGNVANNASGINVRQMLAGIGATTVGQCSGNRTGTMTFDGATASGTTRIVSTINSSGNRAAVTVNLG